MPDELGLFRYENEFDEVYDEDKIREILKIPRHRKACDGFGHHVSCKWIIQECKSRNIYEALVQLEETLEKLLSANYRVDKAFIILDKISKNDKKRYKIDRRTRKLYPINGRNPIVLRGGVEVFVLTKNEVREEVVRWFLA